LIPKEKVTGRGGGGGMSTPKSCVELIFKKKEKGLPSILMNLMFKMS
jgi:hypothetical protein